MKMTYFAKTQLAQALVSVLIVLVVVFALGAALLFHSRSYRDFAALQADTDGAYSLAKSGIEFAKQLAAQDPCGCAMNQTFNLGRGTIHLEINSILDGDNAEGNVTSTGTVDRSMRVFEDEFSAPVGWAKLYNDPGASEAYMAIDCVKTIDGGGYVAAGHYGIATQRDILIYKISSSGVVEWSERCGDGPAGAIDQANAILPLSDGGYVFAGYNVLSGTRRHVLFKINNAGLKQWVRVFPTIASPGDGIMNVVPASEGDGGFVFAGNYSTGIAVVKTDSQGEKPSTPGSVTWAKSYVSVVDPDGPGPLPPVSVNLRTKDIEQARFGGGYLVAAFQDLNPPSSLFLFQISNDGTTVNWDYQIDGSGFTLASKIDIKQTSDGFVVATTKSSDFLLIKFLQQTDGTISYSWAKQYATANSDTLDAVNLAGDGGYIMAGRTDFGASSKPYFVIKTDEDGNTGSGYYGTWSRTYEGFGVLTIYTQSVKAFQEDDGYMIIGDSSVGSNFGVALIKTPSSVGELGCCDIDQPAIITNPNPDFTTPGLDIVPTDRPLFISADFSSSYFVQNVTITPQSVCPE